MVLTTMANESVQQAVNRIPFVTLIDWCSLCTEGAGVGAFSSSVRALFSNSSFSRSEVAVVAEGAAMMGPVDVRRWKVRVKVEQDGGHPPRYYTKGRALQGATNEALR